MSSIQIGSYDFAAGLGKLLASKNHEANLFFSPTSISLAMAMCHMGSSGKTELEMKNILFGQDSSEQQIEKWIQHVLNLETTTKEDDKTTLRFADRLYAAMKYPLEKDYVQEVLRVFKFEALNVDFEQNAENVVIEINQWVEKVTNNKIKNLVPPGCLTKDVALLLINALYFKSPWFTQFSEHMTQKKTFHCSPSEKCEMEMMHTTDDGLWFEDQEVQVLGLAYDRDGAYMNLVLPKERHGLKQVVQNLNGGKLSKWFDKMINEKIQMQIPKFRIEQSFQLNEPLKKLGIQDAFEFETSDFRKMIKDPKIKLKISEVLHKAFIEVDEKGTEAAAATMVKMVAECMSLRIDRREPKQFIADQPFLFLLTAGRAENRTILFFGQYYGKDANEM